MPNNENVGRILLCGMNDPHQAQIEGICKFNGAEVYYVNTNYPEPHGGGWDVWTDEDLQRIEGEQDALKQTVERREAQEETKRRIAEREEREREQAEDLYGFDAGKTPLQRGRILSILMRRERFDGQVMTRRDFIKQAAHEGRKAEIKRFYGDKKDTYLIRNNDEHNSFFIVTKVEYEFYQYLRSREGIA